MTKSKAKLHVASKFNVDQLMEQPLFATNPEAALPLLSMLGQAQLSIEDLLGQLSRQFIELKWTPDLRQKFKMSSNPGNPENDRNQETQNPHTGVQS